VETKTQTLHRLTSYTWGWYEPSRDEPDLVWTVPVSDPRVLQDLEVNDLDRLPWFYKRYGEELPRVPLPRDLPPTTAPAVSVLAGTGEVPAAAVDLPHLRGHRGEIAGEQCGVDFHARSRARAVVTGKKRWRVLQIAAAVRAQHLPGAEAGLR
jgi:hypothetical protein